MNKWRRAHKQRLNRELERWLAARQFRRMMFARQAALNTIIRINMIRASFTRPVAERAAALAIATLEGAKAIQQALRAP